MWGVEQHRHLAEYRSHRRDIGDLDAAVGDLELTVDENVELARLFALGEQDCSRRQPDLGKAGTFVEDAGHRAFAL
jgi:hypothetical protein